MEVYKEIKKDFFILVWIVIVISIISMVFDLGTDDTDRNGRYRSNVTLITDYGTGLQYLYKGSSLVPRLDKNGNHMSNRNQK